MLPTTIDVATDVPSGIVHRLSRPTILVDPDLHKKLECAAQGTPVCKDVSKRTTTAYGDDRQLLISHLARARFAKHFAWVGPLLSAAIDDSVAVAVSDAQLPGFPLVMVNRAFEALTGYAAGEILGSNCRFLQCEQSESQAIAQLADALRQQRPCEVRITNRRKDGSFFVNLLAMRPVLDSITGCTRLVVATQRAETKAHLAGCDARDDAAAMLTAIPPSMRFTQPALPVPCATPMRAFDAEAAVSGSERGACWFGAPVRHHVTALKGLLQLRCELVPSGSRLLLDFLRSHWVRTGRVEHAETETPILDVHLALHSKNAMADTLPLVQEVPSAQAASPYCGGWACMPMHRTHAFAVGWVSRAPALSHRHTLTNA
jgi:PAS domain S-box-containing protein